MEHPKGSEVSIR